MMARTCDACGQLIARKEFIEVGLRVLASNGSESQDAVEQVYGDYCDTCVMSGTAVANLISDLDKYRPNDPAVVGEDSSS